MTFEFSEEVLKTSLINSVNYELNEYSTFIAGSLLFFCKKGDMLSGKFCDTPMA